MIRIAAVARLPRDFRTSAVRLSLLTLGAAAILLPGTGRANDFCPDVYTAGVFPLNINPAFLHVDNFKHANGNSYDGLVVTSFFNAIKSTDGTTTEDYFDRDQVARITGIGYRVPAWFNKERDVEVLTDLDLASPVLPSAAGQTNWPNESQRVPDGILPFESIVVPQGFIASKPAGRLTLINLDDPARQEYIIDQSLQAESGVCQTDPNAANFNPAMQPKFYHLVKWFDMDGDGWKDAVTVRGAFKVNPFLCWPPAGEAVWFKNPGVALDPAVEWEEHSISWYPSNGNSADISLDMYDFEGDGVPEIVGGHFFTGELISIIGAPIGETWADVDTTTNPPRTAQISSNMGAPFQVTIVDLNRDGSMDVLASNHQGDDCYTATAEPIPGKVYALEQPASGDIFNDPWVTRTLKDDIRPNRTYPRPSSGPGRLAPGLAQVFWPTPWDEFISRPWILVGGDEASKVWLLKPNSDDPNDWTYSSAAIFDINDYYGANTTQSLTAPAPATGVSISTIGGVAWRYDRDWSWGSYAEVYIPVFEGRDIHRITFRPRAVNYKISCPADVAIACPVP
jgi:hypothetical protein